MRCKGCGGEALIELRRHNTAYCAPCFQHHFQEQVTRAVERERMFSRAARVLVAVSGGKDSLALWDALHRMGYDTTGLYLDLRIAGYSERSRQKVESFARERGLELTVVDFLEQFGMGVEELFRKVHRRPCSACGLAKRYFFNKVALEGHYDVVATGHNLDDEAATLLGNLLHWRTGFAARQSPVLEGSPPKLARKVKPLFRLTERETAAYAVISGIDYVLEECPMSGDASSLQYKEVLNRLEQVAPGTKHNFLFGFYQKGREYFAEAEEGRELLECTRCGLPTTQPVCAFCLMLERAKS